MAIQNVHVADELGDEAGLGLLVDLARRRHLHDPALVHHRDAVGHGHGLFLVVGDDHEGHAEIVLDVHQLELGFLAQLLVEGAEGLVEEQHLRLLGQRAGKRHALALAAGELARIAPGKLLELDEAQHLADAIRNLVFRQPVLLEAEGDVLLDAHMRKQRIGLEHHVHRPPIGRHAGQVLAAQGDRALARRLEAREHAHERGLAAAGRAEQAEELAFEDVEGQMIHRHGVAEPLRDVLEPDERLGFGVGPGRKGAAHGADGLSGRRRQDVLSSTLNEETSGQAMMFSP